VLQGVINHLQTVSAPLVYVIVGALVFAEAALLVGFVLPAEIAVTTGGFLANHSGPHPHGSVHLIVLMVVVVVCAIAGDSTGYFLGKRFGDRILSIKLLQRYRAAIDGALTVLRKRGAWAVFLGRFSAFLRAMLPSLSGISRMRYRTFFLANATGGLVWGVLFCYLGYAFHAVVDRYAGTVATSLFGLVVVAGVTHHVVKKRRERRAEAAFEAAHDAGSVAQDT
jgi:membrane protein DedA with SNARE-associated domain